MLKSLVRGALVAVTLVTGFTALGAAPAAAEGLRIVVEPVQYRGDHEYRGDRDYRGDRRDRDYRGERRDREYRRDSCRPRLAVRKAYDMGADRPRVVRENRRVVVVDGLRRGRPMTVRFANEGGCPVIGVRR